MAQLRSIERCKNPCCSVVIQVSMHAANTRLERRWITTGREHLDIVIRLEHQSIATAQYIRDVGRRAPNIRQDAQTACAVREHVLERLARVVGYCVREHFQVPYNDALVAPEHPKIYRGIVRTHRARGTPAHVQWNRPFARQSQRSANVIRVLMRDKNCVDLVCPHVEPRQAPLDFLRGETAIQQHACGRRATDRLDQQRVAFAAAAETGKTHRRKPSSTARATTRRSVARQWTYPPGRWRRPRQSP